MNAAIRDLVSARPLNATSVMVTAPSFAREAPWSTLNAVPARAAIGLHLTLTAPFKPLTTDFAPLADGAFLSFNDLRLALQRRLDGSAGREFARSLPPCGCVRPPAGFHRRPSPRPSVAAGRAAALEPPADRAGAWMRQCGARSRCTARLNGPEGLLVDWLSRGIRRRAASSASTNPAFAGTYTYRPMRILPPCFRNFSPACPRAAS